MTAGIRCDHATSSYLETFSHCACPAFHCCQTLRRQACRTPISSTRSARALASLTRSIRAARPWLEPVMRYSPRSCRATRRHSVADSAVPTSITTRSINKRTGSRVTGWRQWLRRRRESLRDPVLARRARVEQRRPDQSEQGLVVEHRQQGSPVRKDERVDVRRRPQVMPNFGLSATFTYRYMNNFIWNPGIGVKASQYVQTGTFTGTFANVGTVSIPYFGLKNQTGPGREATIGRLPSALSRFRA